MILIPERMIIKMNIPKCKDCEFHKISPYSIGTMDRHWCSNFKVRIFNSMDKSILASESKTSPKWCPKRIRVEE